jgi:hypothetical protein
MMKINSIKFKFTLAVFAAVAAVTLVIGVVGYEYEKLAIQNRVYEQLNSIADLRKELVVNYLDERIKDLKSLSESGYQQRNISALLGKSSGAPAKKEALDQLQQRLNSFKNIYIEYWGLEIVDLNGAVIASSEASPESREIRARPGYNPPLPLHAEALRRNASLIVQDGLDAGHLDFVASMPDARGSMRVAIISHIGLADSIFPLFSDYTGLGHTGETLLLKPDHVYLPHEIPSVRL